MAYVADLHIHSRYSRACSPQLNVPNLVEWAKLKGIDVMGTGDCLHPLWFAELKSQLKEDESGFLSYPADPSVKFVLTVEVASIYSHKGAVRRIHNVIMLPSFESAEKLQKALLAKRANLSSDGRPIVGIPSKELLRMCLEIDKNIIFMPAHVWTPWFGIFGSQSGYDSLQDAFEDLTEYIYAVETGLSSDPAMNWRIKELDHRSIISCSDAHSLPNLGREATVFGGELALGYSGMFRDVKEQKIAGTIEFYPEEGKYHYTGHRSCNVKYSPEDTKAKGTNCPVCGRGLTVGVMERVEALASRENQELRIKNQAGLITTEEFPNRAGYKMLVPLLQIIAEAFGTAPTTQRVRNEYKKLTGALGSEIRILTKVGIDEIAKVSGSKVSEGVEKVRKGDLVIDPGYDGVYGVVKIWNHEKEEKIEDGEVPQLELFN
ncbi:MAG: endonuclease Q family protein [Candidatus Daviesbacteria bacterium]|nr:endonuclease Q family protein [Candidatus Daviesbacteria bacterium]